MAAGDWRAIGQTESGDKISVSAVRVLKNNQRTALVLMARMRCPNYLIRRRRKQWTKRLLTEHQESSSNSGTIFANSRVAGPGTTNNLFFMSIVPTKPLC